MKRINKILVGLLLGVTLVIPVLVVSNVKVEAYYTVSGTFGKTRFTAGSTSDTMTLELETDKGWVNTTGGGATLASLSSNFRYFFGARTEVNYILTVPISLHDAGGVLHETYPTGTIMNISTPDITFFDSNYNILASYVDNALVGYYLIYNLYIDDYFLAYNDGYTTGSSQGYNQGQLDYGYYDSATNTWLTATEYALLRYNNGVTVGNAAGFTDGYIEGVTEAYNNGYLSAYAKYMYPDLTSLVENLSYSYLLGFDDGFDDGISDNIYYADGYKDGANYVYDSIVEQGFSSGWPVGLINNEVTDDVTFPFYQGAQLSQQEAFEAGVRKGAQDSFEANLHVWIVPAIILVLVVGGFISFRQVRNRD